MPTLDWIGKRAVLNHHREIPFHLLKENGELTAGDPESGNLVVQGDNLLALKALLPYYAQQAKLIYIDPPYRTGAEGGRGGGETNGELTSRLLARAQPTRSGAGRLSGGALWRLSAIR